MPNGTYTASASGVATPLATEIELSALERIAKSLAPKLVGNGDIVIVNPGGEITNHLLFDNFLVAASGYQHYAETLDQKATSYLNAVKPLSAAQNTGANSSNAQPPKQLLRDQLTNLLKSQLQRAESSVGISTPGTELASAAPTLIGGLPGIVREAAGFWQTNTTESTFTSNFPNSEAIDILIHDIPGPHHVYNSLDAFFCAKYGDNLRISPVYQALERLGKSIEVLNLDSIELDATAQELNGEASLLSSYIKPANGSPPAANTAFGPLSSPLSILERINRDTLVANRLTSISTNIKSYLSTVSSFVNSLISVPPNSSIPPLSTILYEGMLTDKTTSSSIATALQVEVAIDNQAGSTIITEVDPENWTGRIDNPRSKERSPCPRNDVSIIRSSRPAWVLKP